MDENFLNLCHGLHYHIADRQYIAVFMGVVRTLLPQSAFADSSLTEGAFSGDHERRAPTVQNLKLCFAILRADNIRPYGII